MNDPMWRQPRRNLLPCPTGLHATHDEEPDTADRSQDEHAAHAPILGGSGSDPAQPWSSAFAYCTSTGFGGYGKTRVSSVKTQPRRS